jgi:hypothetical protein
MARYEFVSFKGDPHTGAYGNTAAIHYVGTNPQPISVLKGTALLVAVITVITVITVIALIVLVA